MDPRASDKKPSELLQTLMSYRRLFLFTALFSFIINMLMLTPSIYMLQVYDRVMASRNMETLLMLTLIMLFLVVIMGALEFVRSQTLVRLGARMDARLNKRVFDAAFQRNLKAAGGNPSQALMDLTNVRQFLTGAGVLVLFDAPWFPVYLAVLFLMHPILGWLSLAGALVLVGLTALTEKVTEPPIMAANKEQIVANGLTNANLRNAEVIEAMGMIGGIRRRWLVRHKKILALQTLASDRAGVISAFTKFVRIVLQNLLMAVGAYLALNQDLSPGIMVVGSLLGGRSMAPVEMLIGSWKLFISARESYGRLNGLLNQFPKSNPGQVLPKPLGKLTVSNLSVLPPGANAPVLRNLNFEIQPGEVLGIIGPSASGKSCLARLLVGVWRPQSGSVRLDGAEIYQWDKERLGPYMGYLPQDIELFQGTISENIARLGHVNDEWVTMAADKAGVHEMILHLQNGYDTEIGVDGGILSGGQRQRIGLARALYGSPSIVVLDEPNSNLDDAGDLALINAIRNLKAEGKTVVLISHRSAVLGIADKILFLRGGTQQAFGSRDQVFAMLNSPSVVQVHPQQAGGQRA